MKTLAACSLLGSFWAWEVTTKLWELAQTAGCEPICGTGAAPQSRLLTLAHSFIIQMPSQVRAFLPCRKATAWASMATFLGLKPCLLVSAIQVSAWTPASELNWALEPSAV